MKSNIQAIAWCYQPGTSFSHPECKSGPGNDYACDCETNYVIGNYPFMGQVWKFLQTRIGSAAKSRRKTIGILFDSSYIQLFYKTGSPHKKNYMKIILLLASIYALIINQSQKSAPANYSAKEEKISAAYIGKIASRFEEKGENDYQFAITLERKDPF